MAASVASSPNLPTVEAEMNFNSLPSGREVLMTKAEKVIFDYNKCVEKEEKQLEEIKKAVQEMSEMLIRTLEEKMYQKQMKMNEKMQDMILEINTKLEDLEEQEEELKNFSAGLSMFMGDLKGGVSG